MWPFNRESTIDEAGLPTESKTVHRCRIGFTYGDPVEIEYTDYTDNAYADGHADMGWYYLYDKPVLQVCLSRVIYELSLP